MKSLLIRRLAATALAATLVSAAHAEQIYGVTNEATSRLISFDSAAPSGFASVGALSGLIAGHTIRAVDFRPANGLMYAISSSTTAGTGQLYTVNLGTGALTTVGGTFALATTNTRISMDFNPVVDRIRVVSGAGNNLRLNPDTGAIAGTDTTLAYAPGDPGTGTPFLSDVAYTNNVAGATSTTLYAYDYGFDTLATIGTVNGTESPNLGQVRTVGGTGGPVALSAGMGFDISGATGVGYISLDESDSTTAQSEFYTVNLGTGALTLVDDEIGVDVLDFSVAAAPVPEPATLAALGLGAAALLRRRRKSA